MLDLNEKSVEDALEWMVKNEDDLAQAKAAYHDLDRFTKTIKAKLMFEMNELSIGLGRGSLSISARASDALANPQYINHLSNLRTAEEEYLKLEYKLEHNKLICQLWQTFSANRRQSV